MNPETSAAAAGEGPIVARGQVHLFFAADIGFAIDLERAASLLPSRSGRPNIRERRTPSHLVIDPAPLQLAVPAAAVSVGGRSTGAQAEVTLYDFGGALVAYRLPLEGPLGRIVELAQELYENAELAAAARRELEQVRALVAPAVSRPQLSGFLEDYVVYQVEAFAQPIAPQELIRRHGATLASILRAEPGPLSDQEIGEAIGQSMSYRPGDLLVVDWNAAFALDEDFDALRTVLAFANVELAELRLLDHGLDRLLDEAYDSLGRRGLRDMLGMGPVRHELRRLLTLQMDAALVFEQVNNALKLFGDEYLARAYRLASRRLHVPDWDASVLRKLDAVEKLYARVSEDQGNRRMELLEWIIILLIAWEVVWAIVDRARP